MPNHLAKKLMVHKFTHEVLEPVYDDDAATEDMGAWAR
jgi:hypothetical protein